MLIIKYSGAGVPMWTNRYNGPANGYDIVQAAAVGGNGDVFVTGYSAGIASSYDYATIAYSASGVPLWTNRYNGLGNGDDQAKAVAVDSRGNVFVTGYSTGMNGDLYSYDYDYATVAYSGAGVPLWTNRYNGPGNYADSAAAMAVDGSGNVFVTGSSYGNAGNYDYATIAYSGAGLPLWTNRYNGPANGDDLAHAVAVDASGNVFVTGDSIRSPSDYDYATIAYLGAGAPLWTNRYNGPFNGDDYAQAVAVDGSGNVFVTGYSFPFPYYATIAYSATGVQLWTNRYHRSGNFYIEPLAMAVDRSGNLFVTGYSSGSMGDYDYATIAYSGAGAPLWTNRYNGPGNPNDLARAIAVDGSGNVFITGDSGNDFATVAYSGAGVALWTNRYNGQGNVEDCSKAVAVDVIGNVFVTGYSWGGGSSYDYATIAYSAAGLPWWTNRYDGPASGDDYAQAVAVDGSGNVFVTGYASINSSNYDYCTIAYSGTGVPLWTNLDNGPANDYDVAEAVAVDGNGDVFVTGHSDGVGSFVDYATIKYSAAGVPLWTNRYNGPGNFYDYARDIAVDLSGNIFVTGYSYSSGSYSDYATIAYSGAGVPLWTNRYDGPANSDDEATAVAVDGSGKVFVTGYSFGSGSNYDYCTIAYSGSGVPLWTNRYNGPGNGDDYAQAVAADRSGNVFVTGYSASTNNSPYKYVYATIAYSGAGIPLWTNRHHGLGNGDDKARAVAVDGSGNVFVTGSSSGANNLDYATIKYSGAGVPLWTNRYNGPANRDDSPQGKQSLALGPGGSVYVTGCSSGGTGGNDFATVKYISVPLLALERDGGGGLLVHIQGVPDAAYRLQRAPTVTGTWSDIATNNVPASGLIEYHDTSPVPGQAFYRVLER